MLRTWLLGVAAVAWVLLAGCTIQSVQTVQPSQSDSPLAPAPTPSAETSLTPAEHVAMWVRNEIAQQTQLPLDQITVILVEEVEWPDACLGVDKPDEMCAAVITPGFRVVVDTPNGQYEIHTDAEGRSMRIAAEP